ncbi:Alcohol O-acetyltransferase 1 [Wickerhamomyces ciferrii]|uniref:Alcohol O-acetyltransferase 1 n=1 Tax=Wickerhamomyces ciferrii (strain ATCC 14091 / BCRC 22168 / CBS 111 / JCM 3599 / NBRC 0793 / NRRL Y-1031 F-60-10) TaxID=1206466 RepID=K0KXN8_WICCF|nr:Alcohol O-acetyltransferase 1 [Wickerhamomyces ciferrii]CCH46797.1 Alcohol O-acetyltransferase 1 [Wickerhamomyces ciferrii]
MSLNFKYVKDKSEKALADLSKKLQTGHARRMGGTENHFAMFQRLKIYQSYHISATYDREVVDPQLLFKSLRNIIVKNPFLASAAVTQDIPYEIKPRPNDFLKVLDQVKFDDLVWDLRTELKGLPLNKISENLNHRILPYEDGKLFWRVGLIDNNTLAFMTNHVVHDGITAKNFFHDLTQEFNSKDPIEPVDIKNTPLFDYSKDITSKSLIPSSAESIIDYTPPNWYLPEFLTNLFIVNKIVDQTPSKPNEGSYFHTFNINNEQISQIKSKLAKHSDPKGSRLTITSYLQNAWLHTGTKLKLYKNRLGYSGFVVPIDARRYFPSDTPQELYRYGLNTSGFVVHQYPVPELKWKTISTIDKYLKKLVNTKRSIFATGFFSSEKLLKDKHLDVDFLETSKFQYRGGTILTNIGIMGSNELVKDGYNIVDSVFSHHVNGLFYDFSILTVSTKANGLNFVISAPKSTGQEKLDQVGEEFKKIILSDDIV